MVAQLFAQRPVFGPFGDRFSALRRLAGACVLAGGLFAPGVGEAWGFGPSLDEIYRDSLRLENGGVLPGYVINRGAAPYPEAKPPAPGQGEAMAAFPVVETPLIEPLAWPQALREIAKGAPGPLAVETVRLRAERSEPDGLELLAWMYAGGVGVRRDLPRAFELYVQASRAGVDGARENALAIYRAMRLADRRAVFDPFN